MTTIIGPHGERSEEIIEKKQNKLLIQIKEVLSQALTKATSSPITTKGKIEESLKQIKSATVENSKRAKDVVKQTSVNTKNYAIYFLQIILFTLLVYYTLVAFAKLNGYIIQIMTLFNVTILGQYFTEITLGIFSLIITIYLLILLFVITFPFGEEENKRKLNITISKFFAVTIIIIVLVNVLGLVSLYQNYTVEEQKDIVVTETVKAKTTLWENIGCYITLNSACIQDKLTTKQAETTTRTTYSLVFEKPVQVTRTLQEWQKSTLNLNYKIASSGELKVTEFRCYYEKIDEAHLLDSYTYPRDKEINTDGQVTNLPEIKCNMEKLRVSGTEKIQDITIIPVLYMTIDGIYTISIPVISEEKYILETGEKGPIFYLDYKTIEYMKKQNKFFKITSSNNALNFEAKGITNSFPLIYGNNDPLKLTIPIEIYSNDANPLGKVENISFIEEPKIPVIFSYVQKSEEELFLNSTDGNKKIMNLELVEDESQVNILENTISIVNIDIKLKSTIKKEDSSTRFKITVRDIDARVNSQNNNLDSSEVEFKQLNSKYIGLKQSIAIPYTQETQFKINDIENLISLIVPYDSKGNLTNEEKEIKNSYMFGLKVNIDELETYLNLNPSLKIDTKIQEKYISPDP